MAKIQGNVTFKGIDRFLAMNRQTLVGWAENAGCCLGDLMLKVTVEPPYRPRTTGYRSQNHALNGYIQQICMETGQDFGTTKAYIKQMAIAMGYPRLTERTVRGIEDVVDWWGNPVGISESDASVQDCALLIECAVRLAGELGIILDTGE